MREVVRKSPCNLLAGRPVQKHKADLGPKQSDRRDVLSEFVHLELKGRGVALFERPLYPTIVFDVCQIAS
jgi:hypothetical protein